jgi:hypothetical protein
MQEKLKNVPSAPFIRNSREHELSVKSFQQSVVSTQLYILISPLKKVPVNQTQLEKLDPCLRGEDNKSKCTVIPAQAGIQDI